MLCARYIEEIGIGEITFAGSHVVLDEPILFEQGFLLFGEVGAADIFLEIITQPFLGFDGIVPGSSNQATV